MFGMKVFYMHEYLFVAALLRLHKVHEGLNFPYKISFTLYNMLDGGPSLLAE